MNQNTIHNYAIMLHDFQQNRLASSIDHQYKLLDDVRVEGGQHYVTRVDEHSPIRFQTLKDVLGHLSDSKTLMLSRNPVAVQWVGGNPKKIPFDQATVKDWLRLLTVEEASWIKSRNDMLPKVYSIDLEDAEAFPNAAHRLVQNNHTSDSTILF